MPRRKRDSAVAQKFRQMSCVVGHNCWGSVQGDHIKTFGSGGECCEKNMWPLCTGHHLEKHAKGLATFVDEHPKLKSELEKRDFKYDDFSRKWIRLTPNGWDD